LFIVCVIGPGHGTFFQLNSSYFNPQKNIFSKLELNQHIPQQWRLSQQLDDGRIIPSFPLFIKPEWGQNSHGVVLARNSQQLADHRAQRGKASVDYLLQQAAVEKREFEFFYIREADNIEEFAVASLTETINSSVDCRSDDCLAVNGIFNPQTRYHDLSQLISEKELHAFWEMVKPMGCFRVARIGARADSLEQLLEGDFHVIEINIYLPMPLILLVEDISFHHKHQFIRKSMKAAARLGILRDATGEPRYPIFYRKLLAHYKVKE
jgi:hypothetical protein